MLPLISFKTGRKHKLNLLFKTTRWSATANGSLVLSEIGITAERPTHAAKNQKGFTPPPFFPYPASPPLSFHTKTNAGTQNPASRRWKLRDVTTNVALTDPATLVAFQV